MSSYLRALSLLAACAVLLGSLVAQEQGETAFETVERGRVAHFEGRHKEAVEAFMAFMTAFGASSEAKEVPPKILPMLAISQIRVEQFEEAGKTIDEALVVGKQLLPAQVEELEFWRGICALKAEEHAAARGFLESFASKYPRSEKRIEALILAATTHVLEEKWTEAAAALKPLAAALPHPEKGRVLVLRLFALTQAGAWDEAHGMVLETFPILDQIIQISALQVLALEVGNHFLDEERHLDAISCLQRIWPRARVLALQQKRLEDLTARKAAAEARKDAYGIFQSGQLLAKVERELKTFREIASFDPAVRLRLATAYVGMERFREAALVLEAMLHEMPPDPVVESAALTLLQCWSEVERWPKVIENAAFFEERFPKSATMPVVLFLKGQAQQENLEYAAAIATFQRLVAEHAKHELTPRAAFMIGYTQLLDEEYVAGALQFEKVATDYAKDPITESAVYWKGMAFSMNKQHQEAREQMGLFLERYRESSMRTAARFRRAYSAHSMKDYTTGIREFRAFLKDNPQADEVDEARILLGDALMSEGEIEEGIAVLKAVSVDNKKFFEEAWFKVAEALGKKEDFAGMRAHLEEFVRVRSDSPRVAEAVYKIGRSWTREDQPAKAREIYWKAISEMAQDPKKLAVEDLFRGLIRLCKEPAEKEWLRSELRRLKDSPATPENRHLRARAAWALGQFMKKEEPVVASVLFNEAGEIVDTTLANPALLADVAESLRTTGRPDKAEKVYRDLVKWNPRVPQKDAALAALGIMAAEAGREDEALKQFARFERETPGSLFGVQVHARKAEILRKRGESEEALASYAALLEIPGASGRDKATALLASGDILLEKGEKKKAFVYFQRVYVLYSRFSDLVATAYLRSGGVLEALNDRESARRTYEEMLQREELLETKEASLARERLARLQT